MANSQDGQHLERITDLESALAHHQRECEQLNQVVIEQANRIDELHRRVARLEQTLDQVQQQIPENRELADEKPPHY